MGKKASKTTRSTTKQLTLRLTPNEWKRFADVAHLEGFQNAQQWLLWLGRRRANAILAAADAGQPLEIRDVVVVPVSDD